MPTLDTLPTPALLLDLDRLEANLDRMAARCTALGVALRPHLKTHKCVEIARQQVARGARGVTVATLYEAGVFAAHGFDDITWAFPFVPSRLSQARALAERITLRVLVDDAAAVDLLDRDGFPFHVWIKVDCGYHRAGVPPDAARDLAHRVAASGQLTLDGILTHSGHAYGARSRAGILAVAEEERRVMATLRAELAADGLDVAASVGSTPVLSVVESLDGVTEARPGNYAFYDGMQVAIGSCGVADVAVSVLATVVSAPAGASHCVVDAGALALSKDAGTDGHYGAIYADHAAGALAPARHLTSLSQEHGIVSARMPVGERVRILPNHSCLTAACWDEYVVVRGAEVVDRWPIHRGRD